MAEIVSSKSWVDSHPIVRVRIDRLIFSHSPRRDGEDLEHIRLLAEAGGPLPPIFVHRATMRVIDGVHRVRAAMLNGREEIDARLLDCDENAAFILAVQANVTHGLPLSQPDRAAAAARIIADHPQWSDRSVAAATGLSDKTVSKIRERTAAQAPQTNVRLGRDGRLRPLDSGPRRQQAAAMISDRPHLGLREVAQATGLSATTVRDVRQRIHRGEDPVPSRYRAGSRPQSATPPTLPRTPHRPRSGSAPREGIPTDRRTLLAKLKDDPSLRFSEAGRRVLRWLHQYSADADGLESLGRGLPDHWASVIADLARDRATAWMKLAEQLEGRTD